MSVAAALSQTNGIFNWAAVASSARALDDNDPPRIAQTLFSCTSFCMFCVAAWGVGSSSQTSSAGCPAIVLLRSCMARNVPLARYSVCAAICPVLASSKPMRIGSTARTRYGAASGPAARAAAPSRALRRGRSKPDGSCIILFPLRSFLIEAPQPVESPLRERFRTRFHGPPLRLCRQTDRGVGRPILLVAADTLHDLEEEPIVERVCIGVQEIAHFVAVEQDVMSPQHGNVVVRQAPFRRDILVIVPGDWQEARTARGKLSQSVLDIRARQC